MSKEAPLLKKESVVKLEKVLNLWKSKNSPIHQIVVNNRAKKQSEEHNTIMFLGRKLSRKDVHPNSLEDITITSQRLCEKYIEARLARSGIKEFEERDGEHAEQYSNVLQNMGQILEIKYPRLYTKLSAHLKLTYDSEIVVWDSFNKFGSHLFCEGITWAKIIALYAFTGGLALDCMTHGKKDLPGRMVYWFGVFVLKKLASWIQEQGGWNSLVTHFNTNDPCYGDNEDDNDDDDDEYDDINQQSIVGKGKQFVENHRLAIVVVAVFFFLLMVINNLTT